VAASTDVDTGYGTVDKCQQKIASVPAIESKAGVQCLQSCFTPSAHPANLQATTARAWEARVAEGDGRRIAVITGAAGYLGGLTRRHLRDRFDALRLLDLAEPGDLAEGETAHRVDLADFEAVRPVVAGASLVVHLAASLTVDCWDDVLSSNIAGTYNVYRAAHEAGVRRMIYASSHHVDGMYGSDRPIGLDVPFRPDSLYGLSKCFGETLGRYYWDKFGMETVALRIGSARPAPGDERERYTWLSEPDYLRLIDACIAAPAVGFTPVWGVSRNDGVWWDNAGAAHLGFAPRDNAAEHRETQRRAGDPVDPVLALQGGKRALYNLRPARDRV
jgi:uronate dehydrogenase